MLKYFIIFLMLMPLPPALARDVNIYAVCYGTSKITVFDSAGRKADITDKPAMVRTLREHADFLIEGRLVGNDYAAARVMPTIFYLNGFYNVPYLCNHPSHRNYPVCKTFNAHPEWKMKINGEQVYRWAYECFEVMDLRNAGLQQFMASHVKKVLRAEPFFQGVFLDDTSGHFNAGLYGFHKTTEQATAEPGEDGLVVAKVKYTINQSDGPCSTVEVKKSDGTPAQIYGVWHGAKIIFLKPGVRPGERVTITYFSNAPDWQPPDDAQWTEATASLLARIRENLGNRLLIYNGTQLGHDYDSRFLQYADGCMREGFVEGTPSLQQWKADIDRLADISRKKMYFVLHSTPESSDQDILHAIWFVYASFLLGNNGRGYFSMSLPKGPLFHEDWNRDIGSPHGGCRSQGNSVFVREYDHAFVAVNLGEKAAPVTVPPRFEAWRALPGQPLMFGPRQGMVLYRDSGKR